MSDQREPWHDRTVEMPPQDNNPFRRGVAPVGPRDRGPTTRQQPIAPHEPTGTGWPGSTGRIPRPLFAEEARQFRRGGRVTLMGALFAFVCWGLWAISNGGNFGSPIAIFVLTGLVAIGLYALARVVGRVVIERQLGRPRRSARGAHLITAVFLVGVGIAYLRQIEWVTEVWSFLTGLF